MSSMAISRQFERKAAPEQLCNIPRLIEVMEERKVDGVVALLATNQYYMGSLSKHSSLPETLGALPVVFSRHQPDHPIFIMAEGDLRRLSVQPTWIKDIRPFASSTLPFHKSADFAELERFVPADMLDNDSWGSRGRGKYYSKMGEALGSALADLGLTDKIVAFDNLETGTMMAASFPKMTAVGGESLFRHVRAQKTPQEVALLRKATWINQTALERAVADWDRGMSWHDLLFHYQVHALSLGGAPNLPDTNAPGNESGITFSADMEVADYELIEGSNIMFDLHGRYNGYCWDGGKSWVVGGSPRQDTKKNWETTVAVTQEMAEASRTGAKISDLSALGFETVRKLGYNEKGLIIFFHGLGLDHIDQDLSHGNKDWALQRDMVYSIHVAFPGDENERLFLEEILLVKDDSAERIFTWDNALLT